MVAQKVAQTAPVAIGSNLNLFLAPVPLRPAAARIPATDVDMSSVLVPPVAAQRVSPATAIAIPQNEIGPASRTGPISNLRGIDSASNTYAPPWPGASLAFT